MHNFYSPFVGKSTEQKVFGPVLIPDSPDSDGDIVDAIKIEQVAYGFNEKYGNIDIQHSLQNVGKIYTSYILPQDTTFQFNGQDYNYPKGTWMMGVKVTDANAWKLVESGVLTGFSIMAVNPVFKSSKSERVTLADLGPDWIVNSVSLVDNPAVEQAKFISIKSQDSLVEKIYRGLQNLIGLFSKKEEEVIDVTPEEVKAMIDESLAPIVGILEKLMPKEDAEDMPVEENSETTKEETLSEDSDVSSEESEEVVKEEISESTENTSEGESELSEIDTLKAQLEESKAKIAELESAQKSYVKSIKGQDGMHTKEIKIKEDRDSFGRSRK